MGGPTVLEAPFTRTDQVPRQRERWKCSSSHTHAWQPGSAAPLLAALPPATPPTAYPQYGELGMAPQPLLEKLRLALLALTVLPIKVLGTLGCVVSFWACCRLSFLLPAAVRSEVVAALGRWHCRCCLLWLGFWRVSWIRVGDDSAAAGPGLPSCGGNGGTGGGSPPAAAVGMIANHISWCDITIHMAHSFPAFVARSQTASMPLVGIIRCEWAGGRAGGPLPRLASTCLELVGGQGSVCGDASVGSHAAPPRPAPPCPALPWPAPWRSQMMGCLYVDRDVAAASSASGASAGAGSSNGNSSVGPVQQQQQQHGGRVSELVRQRMQATAEGRLPHARPMLLFPEGTTTNGRFMLPFRTGAFLAGQPLQPVVIRYGEVGGCGWVGDG